jgi:mono/diheme cytochrome c family protein
MNGKILATIAGVSIATAGALVWVLLPSQASRQIKTAGIVLKPDDQAVVLQGQRVYQDNCASCHGANLEGQPNWRQPGADGLMPAPPHDETGHTWHHAEELLFGLTKYGVGAMAGLTDYQSGMPIYDGILSDEEIVAVLSYIKSTWPEEIRTRHDAMDAQIRAQPQTD